MRESLHLISTVGKWPRMSLKFDVREALVEPATAPTQFCKIPVGLHALHSAMS